MAHTRLRKFNTKDTYPEQSLDNDLCQAVVTSGDHVPDADNDATVLNTALVCEMDPAIGTDGTGKPEGISVLDQKPGSDGTVAATRFVVVYDHTSFRAEILSVAE